MSAKTLPTISLPTDRATLGYLAGLVDSEGCIGISTTRSKQSLSDSYKINVSITNTDENLIDWLYNTIGGSIVTLALKNNCKQTWRWNLYGNNAYLFLNYLIDFLIIKRKQAKIAIEIRKLQVNRPNKIIDQETSNKCFDLKQKMHELNKVGVV